MSTSSAIMSLKISLDTRLSRLGRGFSSSPQYSQYILQAFSSQKVLNCLNDPVERFLRRDLSRLSEQFLAVSPAEVTYGDLAILIMQNYQAADPPEALNLVKVLHLYFCRMDFLLPVCSNPSREQITEKLTADDKLQLRFLEIPYGDLRESLQALPIPTYSTRMQAQLQEANCFFDEMPLYDIYQSLRRTAYQKLCQQESWRDVPDLDFDNPDSSDLWTSSLPIRYYQGIIEFLVTPIAGMTWKLKKNLREATVSAGKTLRKENNHESEYHE